MDGISFVASVVALAEATFKVVEYLHDVQGSDKQRIRLSVEIGALYVVIDNVKCQLEDVSSATTLKYLKSLDKPNGPLTQCQKVVEELQKKLSPRHGIRAGLKAVAWPFEKEEVVKLVTRVHRLQTIINTALVQANLAISEHILTNSHAVKRMLDDKETMELLNWLSPLNHAAQQEEHCRVRCDGTGKWFLDSEAFQAWNNGKFPILWCPGIPGSGKTITASLAYSHLRRIYCPSDVAVLGVYCDFKSSQAGAQTAEKLIGSLLKQVIQLSAEVPESLKEMHDRHKSMGTCPRLNDYAKELDSRLATFKRAFLVIDALDELESVDDRATFMRVIRAFSMNVSIMVTARATVDVEKLIGPLHHICDVCESRTEAVLFHCAEHDEGGYDVCQDCFDKGTDHCPENAHSDLTRLQNAPEMGITADADDVKHYAAIRITRDENLQELIAENWALKQLIIEVVQKSCQSMFLLAKLHMDHLACMDSVRGVLNALERSPDDLDSVYDQTMARIGFQSSSRVTMAKEVIKWVLVAQRPLHGSQIEHAIKIITGSKVIDQDDIVPIKKLIRFCAGVVNLDFDGRVRFVHYTAEEYFRKFRDRWFPDAEGSVATACLTYLLFDTPPDRYLSSRLPLYSYAAFNWGHHAQKALEWGNNAQDTTNGSVNRLVMTYLSSPHRAAVSTGLERAGVGLPFTTLWGTALHQASYFGLVTTVQELLRHDRKDLESRDAREMTPLLWAVEKGHTEIVKLLCRAGADANSPTAIHQSALSRALRKDSITMVSTLLQFDHVDVNVNVKVKVKVRGNSQQEKVFIVAAYKKEGGCLVKAFLKRPDLLVNVQSEGTDKQTALGKAAAAGQLDIVNLLVADSRTDIDVEDADGRSALSLAARNGHRDTMDVLLKNGANIEQHDTFKMTPLFNAVETGNWRAAVWLYERGASLEVTDYRNQGILHYAACSENALILSKIHLLVPGLELNAQDDNGDTAMHLAARNGFYDAVHVLLDRGARVDIKNGKGETAATVAGGTDIAELLTIKDTSC